MRRRYVHLWLWTSIAVSLLFSAPARAGENPPPIPLIVSSYPATVGVPTGLGAQMIEELGLVDPTRFTLQVWRTAPLGETLITSSGLGDLRFVPLEGGTCTCAARGSDHSSLVLCPTLRSCQVTVEIDASHPAHEGIPLVGEILLLSEGFSPKLVKIELKPTPTSSFTQALAWALGIGVPALLTFLLGLLAQQVASKRTAEDAFFRARQTNYLAMSEFFNDYYANFVRDETFPAKTYRKLVENQLFNDAPPHLAARLIKAVKRKNLAEFDEALRRAFPEFF